MQGTWVRSLGFFPMCLPHAAEQLSPCATTTEPKGGNYRVYLLQIPVCDLEWEKPLQWEACVPQRKSSPLSLQLEKACEQQQRPSTTRNKLIILENKDGPKTRYKTLNAVRVLGDKKMWENCFLYSWHGEDSRQTQNREAVQGKCWLMQSFKRYLPCRKDTKDKVKDKLGIVSNIPARQRSHFLSRKA